MKLIIKVIAVALLFVGVSVVIGSAGSLTKDIITNSEFITKSVIGTIMTGCGALIATLIGEEEW